MSPFTDLPVDILVLIFPYLEPHDFLSLCSTCKALSQTSIRHEPSFWRYQTQTKFRVPNRPAVQADGLRWERLFKKMRTQSRVYTWGQNTHGCLGRNEVDDSVRDVPFRAGRLRRPTPFVRPSHSQTSSWPREVPAVQELGVVADLQCGGWSTTILTDKGTIYAVGACNGMNQWHFKSSFTPLTFSESNKITSRSSTAIRQFSTGRTHVLGLADDGTLWSWSDFGQPACSLTFAELDARVTSVVAGWDTSSCYVQGHGILTWGIQTDILGRQRDADRNVEVWRLIPKTMYRRRQHSTQQQQDGNDLGDVVGEVISYIVLEHFVVFVTDLGKTFACWIGSNTDGFHDIFELPELSNNAKDVQGSFRNFAVIFPDGQEVLIGNHGYIEAWHRKAFTGDGEPTPTLLRIPALQNSKVAQLAFGDYHYHALHADGSISSFGVEPSESGALGLGGAIDLDLPHGMLRGVKTNPFNRDGNLLPHAYSRGRKVWFQPEKETWLRYLAIGGVDKAEAQERMRLVGSNPVVQAEVSEWVEQMGNDWDRREVVCKADEDGLGAHFALSVAAAGWHSGALILVNEQVEEAVRHSCLVDDPNYVAPSAIENAASNGNQGTLSHLVYLGGRLLGLLSGTGAVANDSTEDNMDPPDISTPPRGKQWTWKNQSFPRLTLSNGDEMPGTVPFAEWKHPRPNWKLRWTGDQSRVFGVSGWEMDQD